MMIKKIILTIFITCLLVLNSSCAQQQKKYVSFQFVKSDTKEVIQNTVISVYDGFDKNLGPFGAPAKSDNASFHYKDLRTDSNGIIILNVADFEHQTIMFDTSDRFKYVDFNGVSINVPHYVKDKVSFKIVSHHTYDLNSKRLTIKTINADNNQAIVVKNMPSNSFTIIVIPLDEK